VVFSATVATATAVTTITAVAIGTNLSALSLSFILQYSVKSISDICISAFIFILLYDRREYNVLSVS
jgi:hypothetical protein